MRFIIVILTSVLLIIGYQYLHPYDGHKMSYVYLLLLSGTYISIPVTIFTFLYHYIFKVLLKNYGIIKRFTLSLSLFIILFSLFLLLYSIFDLVFFDYQYNGSISYVLNTSMNVFVVHNYFFIVSIFIIFFTYHIVDMLLKKGSK
jgi:hypothetical protein